MEGRHSEQIDDIVYFELSFESCELLVHFFRCFFSSVQPVQRGLAKDNLVLRYVR